MKAMILAAGLGQRMQPLTHFVPKPLLQVNGQPLIDYHLHKLADAGFSEVIINHAHLGDKIVAHCQEGKKYGLTITYSHEASPLETAGAILKIIDYFDDEPFALINGDVFTDYPFEALNKVQLNEKTLGHLIMVPNPPFHPEGDFAITPEGQLIEEGNRFTYSGIAVLDPRLIQNYPQKRSHLSLGEVYRHWITQRCLSASLYTGCWNDVGTPRRLIDLVQNLRKSQK